MTFHLKLPPIYHVNTKICENFELWKIFADILKITIVFSNIEDHKNSTISIPNPTVTQ